MAKTPPNRTPWDPAKAMRERAAAAVSAPQPLTAAQRRVRKPGLRPLPPTATSDDAGEA